jgi:ATP-binding protein involved in chromosome partitioning
VGATFAAMTKSAVLEALQQVSNASGNGLLVESGHVKNIQIFGGEVELDVVSDSAALAQKKRLEVDLMKAVHTIDAKAAVKVNLEVRTPAPAEQSNVLRGKPIPGVEHVIAVASGKGGVGKSTVTANLAVSLAEMGFSVGVVDADIYGPSMPIMFDVQHANPGGIDVNGVRKMDPVEAYGVKIMSIGFFAGTDQAVVWRGPMATKALNQMLQETHWGELDFLLVDLPPGTGDIHLSLVQALPVTGAVVVSTPQAVALADARKGVGMFRMDAIQIPVLGIAENMAYFTPPAHPDEQYHIFGRHGARNLAEQLDVPFLGELPLVQSIREAGDVGRPAALQQDGVVRDAFIDLARNVVSALANRVSNLPPTEAVRITTMAGCKTTKRDV